MARVFGRLCLLVFLTGFSGHAATDPLWESGVEALEAGKSAQAVELFTAWRTEKRQGPEREYSAELHHNLGLAYAGQSLWGPAAYHLTTSAALGWPWEVAWLSPSLSRIQYHLLIQNAVSQDWRFRLSPFFRTSVLWWLGSMALWLILFGGLWRKRVALGWAVLPVALCAAVYYGRDFLPRYAVVQSAVPLQSEAVPDAQKKLAELPGGVLVALAETSGEYVRITAPFAGWLRTADLKILEAL
ncbi:hypothetical protein K2X33_10080 [bacterium]|nr:hypothetical protein [bacterium]